MTALLLKDLYNLKKQFSLLFIFAAAYGAISILSGQMSFLIGILSVMCIMLPVSSFSFDHYSKWDNYALTLPLTRTQIIRSKYLLSICALGCSAVLSFLVQLAALLFTDQGLFETEFLSFLFGMLGTSVIYNSISLPIMIKLGPERGRSAMIGLFLVPFLLFIILAKLDFPLPDKEALLLLLKMTPLAILLIFFLSYKLSVKWYQDKDF